MKTLSINIVLIILCLTAFSQSPSVIIQGLTGAISDVRVAVEAPLSISMLSKETLPNDIDLHRMAQWSMNYLIRTPRKELNFEPVFQCYPLRCPPVPARKDVGNYQTRL